MSSHKINIFYDGLGSKILAKKIFHDQLWCENRIADCKSWKSLHWCWCWGWSLIVIDSVHVVVVVLAISYTPCTLGLLLADGVGWGKTFFCASAVFFFYKNGRKSETKNIDPEVQNRPSFWGLQTGHRQNLGSHGKKRIFGSKSKIFGPKKNTSLLLTLF